MSSCRVCKRGPGKCRKPGQAGHLDRGSWTESPGPGKKPAAAAAAAAAPTPPARPTRSGSRSGSRRGTAPGSGSGSGSSSTSEESADSEEEEEEDEEDEEEEYEVEKIVAVQQRSAKERPLYRVRWRGYEHDDDTYEPVEALGSAQAKLRAFKQAVPEDEWPGSKLYVREHKGEKVTEAVVREVWAEPRHYFVHFLGWNSKWDEWVDPHRLVQAEKAQAAGHSPAQEPQEVAEEHKVDKLVGFRQSSSGKREYKVRWEGYGPTDDTWEPVAHLSGVLDLVERYDAALKERAEQSKAKAAAAAAAGPGNSAAEQADERLALQLQRQLSGMRSLTRTTERYEPPGAGAAAAASQSAAQQPSNRSKRDDSDEESSESEEEEHVVEAVLKSRRDGSSREYLVKWAGYGSEDNTWEPEENLTGNAAFVRFKAAEAAAGGQASKRRKTEAESEEEQEDEQEEEEEHERPPAGGAQAAAPRAKRPRSGAARKINRRNVEKASDGELRVELGRRGAPTHGTRETLIDRLKDLMSPGRGPASGAESSTAQGPRRKRRRSEGSPGGPGSRSARADEAPPFLSLGLVASPDDDSSDPLNIGGAAPAWKSEHDKRLRAALAKYPAPSTGNAPKRLRPGASWGGGGRWERIAEFVGDDRTAESCRSRWERLQSATCAPPPGRSRQAEAKSDADAARKKPKREKGQKKRHKKRKKDKKDKRRKKRQARSDDTEPAETDREYYPERIVGRAENSAGMPCYEIKWLGYSEVSLEPLTRVEKEPAFAVVLREWRKRLNAEAAQPAKAARAAKGGEPKPADNTPWTAAEDREVRRLVALGGEGQWTEKARLLAQACPLDGGKARTWSAIRTRWQRLAAAMHVEIAASDSSDDGEAFENGGPANPKHRWKVAAKS